MKEYRESLYNMFICYMVIYVYIINVINDLKEWKLNDQQLVIKSKKMNFDELNILVRGFLSWFIHESFMMLSFFIILYVIYNDL